MAWTDLFSALALVLVIEGLALFVAPASLKQTMARIQALEDGALRKLGMVSIALGLGCLYWARS